VSLAHEVCTQTVENNRDLKLEYTFAKYLPVNDIKLEPVPSPRSLFKAFPISGSGYEKRALSYDSGEADTVMLRPQPAALGWGESWYPGAVKVTEESAVHVKPLTADTPICTCIEEVSNFM
jgi:hypothetical protein